MSTLRKSPLFHRAHYNILAAQIRELMTLPHTAVTAAQAAKMLLQDGTLTTLALNLAKRFAEDNPHFDPIRFLDACSPDPEHYPLRYLWEEPDNEAAHKA